MNLIIAANWKMHKTSAEAAAFCREIRQEEVLFKRTDTVICPPFTALAAAGAALEGSFIHLGAQDMFWAEEGAYTGAISAAMLKDHGAGYVIIGHSERRAVFGESDSMVGRKFYAAIKSGLKPILCIGETSEQRENSETEKIIVSQLRQALSGLPPEQAVNLIVAYEPVWAIGTGKAASPGDAEKAAHLARNTVKMLLGEAAASSLRIQYGGSVKADNIGSFVSQPSIDGALVGGASLEAKVFSDLIKAAEKAVAA